MRILRGKSNLEVSSQGFALFVVGLILATFLGGAVRTILSSERVHARIVSELKSRFPRNEFQIGQTEILLSRGLWPGLGLRLRQVTFKQDVCGKLSFALNVPLATLPVDLLSLRAGGVRLGDVEIVDAKMHLDYHDCPSKGPEPKDVPSAPTAANSPPRSIKVPHLDWEEAARSIGGLSLKNFEITYERNATWKLIVKDASVQLAAKMKMRAQVEVQKSLPFGTLAHVVNFEARGEDRTLHWNVQNEYKEGQFRWLGDWNIDSNESNSKIQLVQIPLKDLSSELFQMGLTPRDVKLKTAWLTCQAAWEGNLERFGERPARVHNCKVEGAYGRIDLEQAEVFPNAERPLKTPARLHVQQLQVQPVVESLGRQVLPAVVSKLGVWSGVVNYGGDLAWDLDGVLENAEVVVSNQSVRGKQPIRRVHTRFTRGAEALDAVLNEVELPDGEFAGGVEAHLGADAREGTVEVRVERLSFSPIIQTILVGGQIAPIKINGDGVWNDGQLQSWTGSLSAADVRGEGWRAEDVEFKGKFAAGDFRGEGRATRLAADARWRFYPQLRNVREDLDPAIAWRDVTGRVEIHGQGGTIQALAGTEVASKIPWRARGGWIRDGEMSGTLMVGGPHAQAFQVRGEKGLFTIMSKNTTESRE